MSMKMYLGVFWLLSCFWTLECLAESLLSCPSPQFVVHKSLVDQYNEDIIDYTVNLFSTYYSQLESPVLSRCKNYSISNDLKILPDSLPVIRFSQSARAPLVSLPLKNGRKDISFAGSRRSTLRVFASFVRQLNWTSVALVTDKTSEDISDLEDSLAVNMVIPVKSASSDYRLQKLAKVIVDEHDAAFITCSTTKCYEFFFKILQYFPDSESFSVVIDEDTTHQLSIDMVRDARRFLKTGLRIFGIKKEYNSKGLVQRLKSKVYTMKKCLELSDRGCGFSRERYLESAISLYGAVELAFIYNEHRKSVHSRDQEVHLLFQSMRIVGVDGAMQAQKIHTLYEVLQFQSHLFHKVGVYNDSNLRFSSENNYVPVPVGRLVRERRSNDICSPAIRNPSTGLPYFRITTAEEPPFLFFDPNGTIDEAHHGNLTGFIIDMTNILAKRMGFTYTMALVPDGKYGNVEEENGTPTAPGMIGQILRCESDLSISAIAITAPRAAYVAFTKPWMDYGLTLYRRIPTPGAPKLFAFLDPFDVILWLAIGGSLVAISLLMVAVHFISPLGKQASQQLESHRGQNDYSRNVFTSAWLLYVTAMQQEPDYINFLSGKILLGGWFFFCLIAISTYTANLAAFLTFQRIPDGISSVDNLALQTKIPYGTVRDSAVEQFFMSSTIDTYKKMGMFMFDNDEDAMINTTATAVDRVRNGQYVFIWDSPVLEYFATTPPCTTEVIGRTFNQKGYGIAMPMGMPYLENFTLAILQMRDDGTITELRQKWLEYGSCAGGGAASVASDAGKVSIEHMLGVILLLGVTSGLALLVAVLERLIWRKTRKVAVGAAGLQTETSGNEMRDNAENGYVVAGSTIWNGNPSWTDYKADAETSSLK